MEAVSVQFALLAVSRDTAPTDPAELGLARERVTSAGHVVIAERTIDDSERQIREQVGAWIADPAIDVVLVLAGDSSSKAIKPLITEVLPGFTDLFRWLMFQEAGASAMLSSAEAAECGSTIVFLLPGAIVAAMDKLILPQFDPKTTPKNLVEKLPRLRTEPSGPAEQAVPQPIESEKTQGGSGPPQRLPAVLAPRLRSRTGANVVHRARPTDELTRPIDLGRLENELAASTVPPTDETTQPIVPVSPADAYAPASENDHTDVTLAAPPPPAPLSRIPSIVKPAQRNPTTPPPRGTSTTARPGSPSQPPIARPHTPSAPRSPVRRDAGAPATPMPAVTILPRGRAPSGEPPARPSPGGPPPKTASVPAEPARPLTAPQKALEVQRALDAQDAAAARKRALTPRPMEAAKLGLVAKPAGPTKPVGTANPVEPAKPAEPVEPSKPVGTTSPVEPPQAAEPPGFDAANTVELTSSETNFDAVVTGEVARPVAKPVERATPVAPMTLDESSARAPTTLDDPTVRAPTTRDDEPTIDGAKPVTASAGDSIVTLEASELLEPDAGSSAKLAPAAGLPLRPRPLTGLPPTPRARPITEPPPTPRARPATGSVPVVAGQRTPPSSTARVDALPRGNFVYPQRKRGTSLVLKLLAFAAIIGVGFGAVVLIFHDRDDQPAAVAAAGEPTPPVASPVAPVTPPPTPAATPDPTPPPTPPPTPAPDLEVTPPVASRAPKPRPKPPRAITPAAPASTAPVSSSPPVSPPPDAAVALADDGCEESSCIVTHYEGACCAKFKPVATDFKPRIGDVPESLDKSMVRAGIEHVKPRVVSCGEKSGVKGTVKIALTVSPEGSVTTASVADAPDTALGDCVLAAMRAAKFGKTVNGATFTYPFAF